MRNALEIIDSIGIRRLAAATHQTPEPKKLDAVRKWRINGIPPLYLSLVVKMSGLSHRDVLDANDATLTDPAGKRAQRLKRLKKMKRKPERVVSVAA